MEMQLQQVKSQPILADGLIALRAVDAANADLRARNEARLVAIKEAMGAKYVLHPDNSPRKNAYRSVLDKQEHQAE